MSVRVPWQTGVLWQRLKDRTAHGMATGALQPVETTFEHIEDAGIRFVVRVLANLTRKEKARAQQGKTNPKNPFLPYEQDLYVTDISETHVCLLNKFKVVDNHFLIVTRAFESQENWLGLADFEAMVRCLGDVDGLGFFNGGTVAGASQPHKHLQVVPKVGEVSDFPMDRAIAATRKENGVDVSEILPFRHAIAKFDCTTNISATEQLTQCAQNYLNSYRKLLTHVGINSDNWQGTQTAAYNLLCTRTWMMVVPRSQEKHADISVNSLGFAGSLLVKTHSKLTELKEIGPMTLLEKVGCDRER